MTTDGTHAMDHGVVVSVLKVSSDC